MRERLDCMGHSHSSLPSAPVARARRRAQHAPRRLWPAPHYGPAHGCTNAHTHVHTNARIQTNTNTNTHIDTHVYPSRRHRGQPPRDTHKVRHRRGREPPSLFTAQGAHHGRATQTQTLTQKQTKRHRDTETCTEAYRGLPKSPPPPPTYLSTHKHTHLLPHPHSLGPRVDRGSFVPDAAHQAPHQGAVPGGPPTGPGHSGRPVHNISQSMSHS